MIDYQTVQKIKDAANIVDVVSEFVTLKRSGSNYKGLCPFHNEKTPSFFVSPSRGTCHCFGCGKGGNPIGFIMEHEQMTYPEALKWLARKYHIEVHERELSQEEREEQSRREALFIVNEWAARYFEDKLHHDADGQAIGMQYLRQRGFRDDIIQKFRLGYDTADERALGRDALAAGYKEENIIGSGICFKNNRGELISRFNGRVIFPWMTISGKVVAFTARVLDSRTKGVEQKYKNSPVTDIYQKDHELFGIWQAKKAIGKEDRVFLVEGQADVIAMHQCGLENTVANSGTALSQHQIAMLHRFTSNITLIYDGDAAGIHAALRGADMVLAEGMNLKMVLLPDGQDPDEFARSHTADEFKQYIDEHQVDFIQYKTTLMLQGVSDPVKRAEAISSIVQSISVIPNAILRDTYLHDCALRLGISETTLINQMNALIRERKRQETTRWRMRQAAARENSNSETTEASTLGPDPSEPPMGYEETATDGGGQPPAPEPQPSTPTTASTKTSMETPQQVEQMLIKEVVRHGERVILNNVETEDGQTVDLTLAQFVSLNLQADQLAFKYPLYNSILQDAVAQSSQTGFKAEPYFLHHDNMEISQAAVALCESRYHLSQSQQTKPMSEEDRRQKEDEDNEQLRQQVMHLLDDFRLDFVEKRLKELMAQIKQMSGNMEQLQKVMAEYRDMQDIRNKLARQLGSNIIVDHH